MPADLSAPDVVAVLGASRTLRAAVLTAKGPHVTPELFVERDGRLWSFTAASSLKVRVAGDGARAGVAVGNLERGLVLGAHVTVLDAAKPFRALASGLAIDVPAVAAAFAARHTVELAGGAIDAATGAFGLVPGRWVLLAFDVDAVAVVEQGRLTRRDGWTASADPPAAQEDVAEVALDALPDAVRHLLDATETTVGWQGSSGPIALPARWDASARVASVPRDLFVAVGAAAGGRASLTFDEEARPGPGGKRGVMLRGEGTASTDGEVVELRIDADRAVVWDGTDTSSTSGIRDGGAGTDQTATDRGPNKETRAG